MKGFKLTIKPKRFKRTKNGTYPYLVSGPQKFIDFYKDSLESVLEDDDTGQPMFFHKDLYVFGGEIEFIEDRDYPFSASPNAQSALAMAAMENSMSAMNFDFSTKSSKSDDSDDEDADNAELEKPSAKPKAVVKKMGKK